MKTDQLKSAINTRDKDFYGSLVGNTKRNHFGNLNLKNISNYRKF